jgi:hypothetical protein
MQVPTPPATKLPVDSKARKNLPVATGVVDYFPDALVAIAELSRIGNDKHNPGKPLHWARGKGGNNADELMRHFIERGTVDQDDGVRHSVKVAWRALALLQLEIEGAKAVIPGAKHECAFAGTPARPGYVTHCDTCGANVRRDEDRPDACAAAFWQKVEQSDPCKPKKPKTLRRFPCAYCGAGEGEAHSPFCDTGY